MRFKESQGKGSCTRWRHLDTIRLEAPELNVDERIDFVFLVPADRARRCKLVRAHKRRSGLFAAEPNPFVDACGPTPDDPICWASDHNGNFANVRCAKRPHKRTFDSLFKKWT
jgi:hypothetical protein